MLRVGKASLGIIASIALTRMQCVNLMCKVGVVLALDPFHRRVEVAELQAGKFFMYEFH